MKEIKMLLLLMLLFSIEVSINNEKVEPTNCGNVIVYSKLEKHQCLYYLLSKIYWQQEEILNTLYQNKKNEVK